MLENDSISHHTSGVPSLSNILRMEAFKVQYCTEKIYVNKHTSLYMAIPMVSFADIRPSDYVQSFWKPKGNGQGFNLGYYGDYAIGLSKDWAVRKNIIPILYVPKPKDSGKALSKNNPIACLSSFASKNLQSEQLGQIIENIPPIASYCKHYVGVLEQGERDEDGKIITSGIKKVEYSFHLEQEWRYVSPDIPVRWNFYKSMKDADYEKGRKKKEESNKAISELLDFDLWEDVTYIIVKSNNACSKILALLDEKYQEKRRDKSITLKYLDERYAYLRSCVITTEQLVNNL